MSREQLDNVEHQPLEDFTKKLDYWRDYFDTHKLDEITEDNIATAEIELCDTWPYNGEFCYYSGMGMTPAIYPRHISVDDLAAEDADYETVSFVEYDNNEHYVLDEYDYIPGKWGTNYGFKVANFDGGDHYKVYFKFYDFGFEDDTSTETLHMSFHFYSYLSSEGNVMPESAFDAGDSATERALAHDLLPHITTIDEAATALQALYRSVPFRRQHRLVQIRQVDGFLAGCEQKFGITVNTPVEIQSDEVYKAVVEDGRLSHQYVGTTNEDEPLRGYFLGYGSPERVELDRRAIRRDTNLLSRTAGLCAVVELAGQQPRNFGFTDGLVYAAVRSNASIVETTIRPAYQEEDDNEDDES